MATVEIIITDNKHGGITITHKNMINVSEPETESRKFAKAIFKLICRWGPGYQFFKKVDEICKF